MDEQTFRRLAPDAVAGRLDPHALQKWKDAAAQYDDRAAFAVRVAQAEARLSGVHAPARRAEPSAAPVRKRTFRALALVFAVVGAVAGGLLMNSYINTNSAISQAASETPDRPAQPTNTPEPEAKPTPLAATNEVAKDEPEVPDAEDPPDVQPPPTPQPAPEGLHLTHGEGVSLRGPRDDAWRGLAAGETIPAGAVVGQTGDGRAQFSAPGLRLTLSGVGRFEYRSGEVRLIAGRFQVRTHTEWTFTCYKASWTCADGAFVVEPRSLGGALYLLEGTCSLGRAPLHAELDGTGRTAGIEPDLLRELEIELLGPHRRLLWWDGESPETTPGYGERVTPGALGDGHAIRRRAGEPGIGVPPAVHVFTGAEGARLRVRVRTDARHIRLELRLHLEDGYRAVDADVPVPRQDEWCVLDVPLSVLRAGRGREEPGWLPGQGYSALVIAPGVDSDNLLKRHELTLDDLLVYVPEDDQAN